LLFHARAIAISASKRRIGEPWEAPRRFRHRREAAVAQEGRNLQSDRWIFIRFGFYLFCFFFK
jgi:hypothetical protein